MRHRASYNIIRAIRRIRRNEKRGIIPASDAQYKAICHLRRSFRRANLRTLSRIAKGIV